MMVLGNWKSNGDRQKLTAFLDAFDHFSCPSLQVGIAIPDILMGLFSSNKLLKGSQNVSAYGPGAYTGETHTGLLNELAVDFCLIGHSERRQLMGETITQTNEKLLQVQQTNLTAVFCVGETLEERQAGRLETILDQQLSGIQNTKNLVIAYEPVWAIGTGMAATPSDAEQAHQLIALHFKNRNLESPKILYGGSVKPENAEALGQVDCIDGFLVGGASLSMEQFGPIIQNFALAKKLD